MKSCHLNTISHPIKQSLRSRSCLFVTFPTVCIPLLTKSSIALPICLWYENHPTSISLTHSLVVHGRRLNWIIVNSRLVSGRLLFDHLSFWRWNRLQLLMSSIFLPASHAYQDSDQSEDQAYNAHDNGYDNWLRCWPLIVALAFVKRMFCPLKHNGVQYCAECRECADRSHCKVYQSWLSLNNSISTNGNFACHEVKRQHTFSI